MYRAKKMDYFNTSIFTELKEMKQAYVERTGQEPIDFSIGSPNIPPVASIVSEIEKQVAP